MLKNFFTYVVFFGSILLLLINLNQCNEPTHNTLTQKDINAKIKFIKKKINAFQAKTNNMILNPQSRSNLIKKLKKLNAEKLEKKIFKMETRIRKQQQLLSRILKTIDHSTNQKHLNDLIKYFLFLEANFENKPQTLNKHLDIQEQQNYNVKLDLCLQNKDPKYESSNIILSPDCYIDQMFEGEVSLPEFVKALLFTMGQILFSTLGIIPLYKMVTRNNKNQMLILSEWSFLFNIMLDFVLIIINLRFSMKILVEYFEFLTIITMFLMFSILFKVKFYVNAYDVRYGNLIMSRKEYSSKKFFFILKFTGCCFFFISCSTLFIEYEFLFYILFCYPLFQVWHNVTSVSQNNCFLWSVHPFLAFSQVLYPIVMKGLHFSFFKLTPVPYFSYILVLQIIFCMIILFLQKILGATFFLPKCFIPNYYNYFRFFEDRPNSISECCPICFEHLKVNILEKDTCDDETIFFETPCGHRFHESCLTAWIEVSLSCPNCRSDLPPVI